MITVFLPIQVQGLLFSSYKPSPSLRNLASKTAYHKLTAPGKDAQVSEVFFEHEKDK